VSCCPSLKETVGISLGLVLFVGGCFLGQQYNLDAPETVVLSGVGILILFGCACFINFKCKHGKEVSEKEQEDAELTSWLTYA